MPDARQAERASSDTGIITTDISTEPIMSTTSPQLTSEPCHLKRLPAELRNNIYESVFDFPENGMKTLYANAPFSKSLILTCREIHDEAAGIYKSTYRKYWSTSHFTIQGRNPRKALKLVPTLSVRDVWHIKKITITNSTPSFVSTEASYAQGVWYASWRKRSVVTVPGKGARTGVEESLIPNNYYQHGGRSWGIVYLDSVGEELAEKARSCAKTRALSLHELEGAVSFFLPMT